MLIVKPSIALPFYSTLQTVQEGQTTEGEEGEEKDDDEDNHVSNKLMQRCNNATTINK